MIRRRFMRNFATLVVLCVTLGLATSAPLTPARADSFLDQVESVIDATGALPFKFSDWAPVLNACANENVEQCIDAAAQSPAASGTGADAYLPKMVAIYFDIRNKDYWGLLADAGETVACAAANILTGVDICGAIKTLIDAAKDVATAAADVAKFFADLGEDIYNGAKDLGCDLGLWGGCGSGSSGPPPSAADLARSFLASKVVDGFVRIKQSWKKYVDYRNQLPNEGAASGFSAQAINDLLGWYDGQVEPQWDVYIIKAVLPDYEKAVASFKTPAMLNKYVGAGMDGFKLIDWNPALDPYAMPYDDKTKAEILNMLAPLWSAGSAACQVVIKNVSGAKIKDWLLEQRPDHLKLPRPADPDQVCRDFTAALQGKMISLAIFPMLAHWTQGCAKPTSGAYKCDNRLDGFRCNAASYFFYQRNDCGTAHSIEDQAPPTSTSTQAPPEHTWLCGPKHTPKKTYTSTPPPGCTAVHSVDKTGADQDFPAPSGQHRGTH